MKSNLACCPTPGGARRSISRRNLWRNGFVGSFLVLSMVCAYGQGILIGYTNCLDVGGYSSTLISQIGQFRWYFAHASVGGNMMDGIADLHSASATSYPIQSVGEDGTPPGTTANGVIYQHDRGNPGWQAKVDTFQTCVNNGWRFPKVNLAVNKFCYIDQDANLGYYLGSMTNLESARPEMVFVYMTIPLTASSDYDNYLRNVFNDGLRNFTRTNNRVLLDIADMEAHDTSGVLCAFSYNSRTCQRLYSGYSSDGGHLNTTGRQLVAKGFYALACALLASDRDADGLSDGQELIAGTRPTDPQSGFRLSRPALDASKKLVLQWTSASNRVYTLQRGSSVAPGNFTNLVVNAVATPPMNTFTDEPPPGGSCFYRVTARQ